MINYLKNCCCINKKNPLLDTKGNVMEIEFDIQNGSLNLKFQQDLFDK